MDEQSDSKSEHNCSLIDVALWPSKYLFPRFSCRVNSLDAERLHKELLFLLKTQLSSCWSLVFSHPIPEPELRLLLRLILFFASTYHHQPVPSDSMFNIKLSSSKSEVQAAPSPEASVKPPSQAVLLSSLLLEQSHQNLSPRQTWGYFTLVVVAPWMLGHLKELSEKSYGDYNATKRQVEMRQAEMRQAEKLRGIRERRRFRGVINGSGLELLDSEEHENEREPPVPFLARLHSSISYISILYDIMSLSNFLIFLAQGRYRSLEERFLGLEVNPIITLARRQLDFTYLRHHMYWHTVTEFLLAVVPTLDVDAMLGIARRISRIVLEFSRKRWKQLGHLSKLRYPVRNDSKRFEVRTFWLKLLYRFLEYITLLKERFRHVLIRCTRITDPTSLDLAKYGDSVSPALDPESLQNDWLENRSPGGLLCRLTRLQNASHNDEENIPVTSENPKMDELLDDYGERLVQWFYHPSEVPCTLCHLSPVTLPAIGNCHCLSPFCYLCVTVKQMTCSSFICPGCGTLITKTRQLVYSDFNHCNNQQAKEREKKVKPSFSR